jgi:hypothetical protein
VTFSRSECEGWGTAKTNTMVTKSGKSSAFSSKARHCILPCTPTIYHPGICFIDHFILPL